MTEPIGRGLRQMTMPQRLVLVSLVSILLVACASASGPDTPVDDRSGGGGSPAGPTADGRLTIVPDEVDGPALQVRDALAAGDGPVRVAGALFVAGDGRVLLCSAIAESYPPQCGGERLEVVGLDLDTVAGLQEANGVRWADAVELSGSVD